MDEEGKMVIFNPDDVNTAEVKAICAEFGLHAKPSRLCPSGRAFIIDMDELNKWKTEGWSLDEVADG